MTGGESKTVVFGLDGACFDLLQPWLDAGALPTLQALIDRGGRADLTSCVPATTPPAWTSLTTGVNPGKHGIFGFYRRQQERYDLAPVSDADVYARRLWDYASAAGQTSLVVNVPVTHPARPLDGVLIPGYLAPNDPETHPPDVLDDVDMTEYRVYADSEAADVPEEQLCDEWLALTESRRELALRLLDAYDWELLFLEFQKTDGAVHKFADRSRIRRIYERVDDCLATILEGIDGDPNVFVVSDHGIGQAKEWAVALNTWLVEQGYATITTGTRAGRADQAWLDRATGADGGGDITGNTTGENPGTDPVSTVLTGLSRLGLTKQRLERALSTLGVYDLVVRHAPEGTGATLQEEVIDRPGSSAFYEGMGFSGVDVGVVINDARFYDDGVVAAEEYDALREELLAALRNLTGPDGERAFSNVRPREAVYDGERVTQAPDIVLEQAPDYVIGSKYPRGKTFIPTETGRIDHTRNGLLIAAGPDIESGWTLDETPSIVDVTPTLVHLLDIPLNERFDGRVLDDLLSVDRDPQVRSYESYTPPKAAALTADEEAALEDRLKGMGYLE